MQRKRVMWLLIIGLFFLSVLIGLVSAQTPPGTIFDPVRDMFASWLKGDLSVNVAKYLLVILLTAIIYSILDLTPFLRGEGKSSLRWLVAFIVGFLGTAYLNASDIYAILASYNALGFVLSAAVPFIILLFLSIQTHKDGGPMGRIFSRVIWVGFIVFLVYKLISGYQVGLIKGGMVIGYLIVLGFSLAWAIFLEKEFVKLLFKEERKTMEEKLVRKLKLQSAKRNAEAKSAAEEVSGS